MKKNVQLEMQVEALTKEKEFLHENIFFLKQQLESLKCEDERLKEIEKKYLEIVNTKMYRLFNKLKKKEK